MSLTNSKITIQYIKRSRRLSVRVRADGSVKVTAPYGYPEKGVYKFLEDRAGWIEEKQTEALQKKAPQYNFSAGEKFPFLGKLYSLSFIEGDNQVFIDGEKLIVSRPSDQQNEANAKQLLMNWYQEQAFIHIKEQVMNYSALLGLAPQSVSIKNYKSRWGACSSKGHLIFNWQIVALAQNHFDYVVAHEVCHLKEMNHSPRFYKLLSRLGFEKNQIHAEMRRLRNPF